MSDNTDTAKKKEDVFISFEPLKNLLKKFSFISGVINWLKPKWPKIKKGLVWFCLLSMALASWNLLLGRMIHTHEYEETQSMTVTNGSGKDKIDGMLVFKKCKTCSDEIAKIHYFQEITDVDYRWAVAFKKGEFKKK